MVKKHLRISISLFARKIPPKKTGFWSPCTTTKNQKVVENPFSLVNFAIEPFGYSNFSLFEFGDKTIILEYSGICRTNLGNFLIFSPVVVLGKFFPNQKTVRPKTFKLFFEKLFSSQKTHFREKLMNWKWFGKTGLVTIHSLWSLNFLPSLRKILWEKCKLTKYQLSPFNYQLSM